MLMMKKRNLLILIVVALLVGSLATGGMFLARDGQRGETVEISKKEYADFQTFQRQYGKLIQLRKYIDEYYFEPVDEDGLEEGMYKGLFWGIGDPYSGYMNKEEYEKVMKATNGEEFYGVGLTLLPDENGYINVVAPIDDTPAAKAGIKSNDKVVKVDGTGYDAGTIDDAVSAMRGSAGTEVEVTVLRDGEEKTFTLKRAKIHTQTVKSEMLDGNYGYIRVSSFEEKTGADFKEQLAEMEKKKVKGLVIDLRDNPGGLVDGCIEIADLLLDDAVITYTEDRKGNREIYQSKNGKTDLPYVLLVNGGSASASEIVACAIKDNKGGTLIGTTSYGKGIIQSIEPVSSVIEGDESGGAVKLTVMQYYSPNGNVIHGKGIAPDIEVEITKDDLAEDGSLPRENDRQLQKALEVLGAGTGAD